MTLSVTPRRRSSATHCLSQRVCEIDVPIDPASNTSRAPPRPCGFARLFPSGERGSPEAQCPLAVRAAASAIAKNPLWLLIPCHRVIASNGTIGSYGPSGVERKRALLKREGVVL
jgi:O-6-methylguanine DNA methyltransferase